MAGTAIPTAQAVDVSDADVKLSLILNLQTRMEIADAKDTTGENWNIESSGAGESDVADFYIRRFRPGFKGTYQNDWKFAAIMRLDETDRAGASRTTATIHQAWIAREFKGETITHTVKMGLDYAFFNQAEASNSATLLPVQRASHLLMPVRGTGLSYMLNHPMVRWGVDIQNNTGDNAQIQVASSTQKDDGEGLAYTTRVEITGPGDLALPKWQESWAGKEGTGFIVGLDLGQNDTDRAGAAALDTFCWGIDVVGHWNNLSALIEMRQRTIETDPDDPAAASVDDLESETIMAQVGYAIPWNNYFVEPAIRYSIIDVDTDDDNEAVNYNGAVGAAASNRDYGSSGEQIDLGVNLYLNSHSNKLSLAYSIWEAEEGDAEANILRLQHQLNF
jgi:hypothetical protein